MVFYELLNCYNKHLAADMASAEAYRVPVILVFNKTDLLDADGQQQLEGYLASTCILATSA